MILVCSVIVRVSNSSRTLEEYALENPEIAYATPQKTEEPSAVPTESPTEEPTAEPDDVIYYEKGFFYCPIPMAVKEKITGVSYPATDSLISYDDLYYMQVLYYDFNGEVQTGELICNRSLAPDFAEIFYELYRNEYQIEKIRLIDEYGGDDTASMIDNNTSCFNYRVVDGSNSLSKHAMGCAIDINPFYNPYVVFNKDGSGENYISPPGSEIYADRSKDFPYKIDENDLCYKLFKEHGFTWGGDWNSCKDYQHFQKVVE
ncbi:MAG: M15 family metallopeptidase [Lachnospiraceae bacterium]|nr:M15 family metallopeptidase [Lachnospiraceae bacterium]